MPNDSFSVRVENDPRFFSVPPPPPSMMRLIAVRNQLLVKWSDRSQIISDALSITGGTATELTTLYTDLQKAAPTSLKQQYDISVFELDSVVNIYELVHQLRGAPYSHGDKVSVNSVLIPADFSDHHCPFGPPSEDQRPRDSFPDAGGKIEVSLIDVGYQWDPSWDPNPLGSNVKWVGADQLPNWQPAPQDPPAYVVPGTSYLAALDGHANFTAGVILQVCDDIRVTMRCNSSTFDATYTSDFPSEMTAARALCESEEASVVDLAYAYKAQGDIPSGVWLAAVEYLRELGGDLPIVVCPAGNQSDSTWRFPAALPKYDPKTFRNVVVGVGSIDEPGPSGHLDVSEFSNWGDWVTCYANGSTVHSTFIRPKGPVELEEDPIPRPQHHFANAWATWNGTCFASAKIAAAIACTIANPPTKDEVLTPSHAWQLVRSQLKTYRLDVPGAKTPIKGSCLMAHWG
jgi:Subtilase family